MLSKTQEKRIVRDIERIEFLLQRRRSQVAMFEQGVAIGLKLYEDNKDKLSEDQIKQLDEMRLENERLLAQIQGQIKGLEDELDQANKNLKA